MQPKPKSLGQIAREAYWWPQCEPCLKFVQKDWDRAARAVKREVLRRLDHYTYWRKVQKLNAEKRLKKK